MKPVNNPIENLVLLILFGSLIACHQQSKHDAKPVEKASLKTTVKKETVQVKELPRQAVATLTRFIIPENGTYLVNQPSISFEALEMKNNAKIVVDPSLKHCEIIIADGIFGANCEIIGDGKHGTNAGPNMEDPWIKNRGWWQANSNTDGQQGYPGLNGGNASEAQSLDVEIGVNTSKSLYIHSNGGIGGNGSNGCQGQYGGSKRGPFGHHGIGGVGGVGGAGGNGTNGGSVLVKYWYKNTTSNSATAGPNISLAANAGLQGIPGKGGFGGATDGGGGSPIGMPGRKGIDGLIGTTHLSNILRPHNIH